MGVNAWLMQPIYPASPWKERGSVLLLCPGAGGGVGPSSPGKAGVEWCFPFYDPGIGSPLAEIIPSN
jgi:hypothetical protein